MDLTIIVPAYNAQDTMERCLAALCAQAIPVGKTMEIIIVDDGSSDATPDICRRFPVTLLTQNNRGAPVARNAGIARARGKWIAFTDADCVPSRRWSWLLVEAAERAGPRSLGAAGRTVGYESNTPAARFVDLSGGLDAEKHLAYHLFPFAPTANVLYRRSALLEVGSFDERFHIYDATDIHHRLLRHVGGDMIFEPRAVVLHKHRATWKQYWKQQMNYGRGYAQLFIRYPEQVPWSLSREIAAWARLAWMAPTTLGRGDAGLVRRGTFVKHLAQRVGFVRTYYNKREHLRFAAESPHPLFRGCAMIPFWIRIGIFIWRLPREIERRPLDQFLAEIAAATPRIRGATVDQSVRRIAKITRRWLRLKPFRRRNTCYTRSLVLFRFLDPAGGDLRFHLGTEPARTPGANIHGHAWVTLDGKELEPLPASIASRLSDLYTFPPGPSEPGRPSRLPVLQSLSE